MNGAFIYDSCKAKQSTAASKMNFANPDDDDNL